MTGKDSRACINALNKSLDDLATWHEKIIEAKAQALVDASRTLNCMWVSMGEIGFADSKNRALHHNYIPREAKHLVAYILRYMDVFGTPTFVVRKKR